MFISNLTMVSEQFEKINEFAKFILDMIQGRIHAFESEGAQYPKAILGPLCLKKWEDPSLLSLLRGGGTY